MILSNFLNGLGIAVIPSNLLSIVIGVVWGIIGGAIPGINASIAMALMLPMTYGMDIYHALPMLAAVYVGAEYGGSIPAILIKTPGTSSAAATVLDGYEMNKNGEGGKALLTSLISGVSGGLVSVLCLIIFAIPLSSFGLKFGPSQYALMGLMGLSVVGSVAGKNPVKGFISALFGLWIATIGLDPITGSSRYMFGYYKLMEGLDIIPVIVGFFAISEILCQIYDGYKGVAGDHKVKLAPLSRKELKTIAPIVTLSGLAGTFLGALPGAGATIASWLAYSQTKQLSKNNETFGHGDIRGVAAPESANNAVPAGALIPLLALGIPGSNSTAILMAGFNLQGVAPGPLLFTNRPELPYTMMACMLVAQLVLLCVGLILIRPALLVTTVPQKYMNSAILMFCFIGAYCETNDPFSIVVALVFGIIGFIMKINGFSGPAAVLGFVLGNLVENNVRRAMVLSRGSLSVFFSGGINIALVVVIIATFIFPFLTGRKKQEK